MEPAIENQELKTLTNCELDYISQLPNSVVHQIYSLLPARDVASTSVLSRAWNSCWCTYPYAEFYFAYNNYYPKDQNELPLALQKQEFLDLIGKAVLRRLGREFYLQRFQIYIEFSDLSFLAPLLNQWISIAIRKGVSEFGLRVEIGLGDLRCHYSVPQVVMQADALKVLSLSGSTFGSGLEVRLPHLKKLSLHCCEFVDELSFHIIMSGCPVIEYLKISYCGWTGKVLSLMNLPLLKHFEFLRCKDIDNVEIYATNLHTLSFAPALNQQPQSFDLKSCRALRELKLYGLGFFSNFLPKHLISQLPALEVLEFQYCTGSEDFRISSQMLKRLVFRNCCNLKLTEVDSDTPNLESLEYCHSGMPCVLINASTNLKLHLIYERVGHVRGLTRLRSFLSTWSSKVNLKLVVHHNFKNMIIHERLSDIPLSSLCNFIYSKFICISSKSLTDLMDELIPLVYPEKVYIVYSHDKTVEVLSKKIKGMSSNPNLQHKLFGFKVNTCEDVEDRRDPVTSVFIEKYSIPPYKNSILTLNWMHDVYVKRYRPSRLEL